MFNRVKRAYKREPIVVTNLILGVIQPTITLLVVFGLIHPTPEQIAATLGLIGTVAAAFNGIVAPKKIAATDPAKNS